MRAPRGEPIKPFPDPGRRGVVESVDQPALRVDEEHQAGMADVSGLLVPLEGHLIGIDDAQDLVRALRRQDVEILRDVPLPRDAGEPARSVPPRVEGDQQYLARWRTRCGLLDVLD